MPVTRRLRWAFIGGAAVLVLLVVAILVPFLVPVDRSLPSALAEWHPLDVSFILSNEHRGLPYLEAAHLALLAARARLRCLPLIALPMNSARMCPIRRYGAPCINASSLRKIAIMYQDLNGSD